MTTIPETFEETRAIDRIIAACEKGGYTAPSRETLLGDCRTWNSYGDGGMWELVDRFEAQVADDEPNLFNDTESYDGEPVYDGDW